MLLVSGAGAQGFQLEGDSIVEASSFVQLRLKGSGLGDAEAVLLSQPGLEEPIACQILGAEEESLEAAANLLLAPVGLYTVEVVSPQGTKDALQDALQVTRPPWVTISGPPVAADTPPLAGVHHQSATEMIVLQEELPPPFGWLEGISFRLADDVEAPQGTATLRYKTTEDDAFSTTELDASGWLTLYTGPVPEPGEDGWLRFDLMQSPADETEKNIVISVTHEQPQTRSDLFFEQWTAGERRGRRGVSLLNLVTPPEEWEGSVPPERMYLDALPVMRLHFAGRQVSAEFEAEPLVAGPGEPITFRSLSSPEPTEFHWDLTGDGNIDATGAEVVHSYDESGTYRVVLRVRDGFAEDAETKPGYITIIEEEEGEQDVWMIH